MLMLNFSISRDFSDKIGHRYLDRSFRVIFEDFILMDFKMSVFLLKEQNEY